MSGRPKRRHELELELLRALVLCDDGAPTSSMLLDQLCGLRARYEHWHVVAGDSLRALEARGFVCRMGGGWTPTEEGMAEVVRVDGIRARLRARGLVVEGVEG